MQSIFAGALWLTGANLLMRAVSMVFQVYLNRILGAAGVGLLQLILAVCGFAMTLGTAGARVTATCLVAQEYGFRRPGGIRKAVSVTLVYGAILSTLGAAALFFLAPWLAETWIGDSRALASLRIFALALPLNCLWAVLAGYFTASNQVRRLVAVRALDRLAVLVFTLPLLRFWAGEDVSRCCCAVVAGDAGATAVSFGLLLARYLRTRPAREPKKHPMVRRLLALCGPLAFNEAARSALGTLENLLIPRGLRQSGQDYESAMGDYGAIQGMTFPVMMLPAVVLGSVSELLVPELAKCKAQGNTRRIHYLIRRCLRPGLVYAGAVSGLLLCCGQDLGALLYPNTRTGTYLVLFAPVVLVLYLDAVVDGLLKGLIEQVASMRYNTLTSILDVALLFVLLPRFGTAGFFFSFVVSHVLNFFLSLTRLLRVSGYSPDWGCVLRTALAIVFALGLTILSGAPLSALSLPLRTLTRSILFLTLLGASNWISGTLSDLQEPSTGRQKHHA